MGVHELGILDHATALARQMVEAGSRVSFTVAMTDPEAIDVARLRDRVAVRVGSGAAVFDHPVVPGDRPFDAILVQTPYDEQRTEAWGRAGVSHGLSYAGYGLAISNWERGHFELPMFARCRHLLVSSPDDVAEHVRRGRPPASVRHTGDALLFELRTRLAASVDAPAHPRILWMPHWTEDWFGRPGYTTWNETVVDLLDIARTADALFVMRPHPLLSTTLVRDAHTDAGRTLRSFLDLPNVVMSTTGLVEDLTQATAVLTDGVSVISYSAASGLAVGVCRRADSPPFGVAGTAVVSRCETVVGSHERRAWIRRHVDSVHPRQVDGAAATEIGTWFPLHERSPGELFTEWIVSCRSNPTP